MVYSLSLKYIQNRKFCHFLKLRGPPRKAIERCHVYHDEMTIRYSDKVGCGLLNYNGNV